MKSFLFVLIVLFVGISATVSAQTSATVTGTEVGAKIIVPMTLSQTAPLNFGTITEISATAGTIVLPCNSTTRVFTGGFATSAVAPVATNAAYNVTGTASSTYALTLPVTTVVTNTTTPAVTMNVTLMTAQFNGTGPDAVTSTLSAEGTDSFTLGGTLSAAGVQPAGTYAGAFNVTVDYN